MSRTRISATLRRLVRRRGEEKCEYCLFPEELSFASHEVDHIIAEKHGGFSDEGNLALSCALCNGYKGSDIASVDPLSGVIVPLFHPRLEHWSQHFSLNGPTIVGITATGRATVRLLQLNHPHRIREREAIVPDEGLSIPNED